MDGGRRFLRSLKESLAALLPPLHARPAVAGSAPGVDALPPAALPPAAMPPPRTPAPRAPLSKRGSDSALRRAAALPVRPGVGAVCVVALFAIVGGVGFVQNGGYAELVAREGAPQDILARAAGFRIDAVTITGQSQIGETDLLAASGVDRRNSLLFLDAVEVRDRLMKLPLIKTARVLKLYPNRLVVAIEERQPQALWQRDGRVYIISSDGTAIDELRDERHLGLPFVVGDGAEKRLLEYTSLRALLGEFGSRIKAGVFVAGRRWNLETTNGISIKLPERDPVTAMETLQRLQRESRIFDKDILSIDLRAPGRVVVRLTEEGVAAREAGLPRNKSHKSGG